MRVDYFILGNKFTMEIDDDALISNNDTVEEAMEDIQGYIDEDARAKVAGRLTDRELIQSEVAKLFT